jgi:hypothetical protein
MDGYQASKLTYFDIISFIMPGGVMVARRALDAEIGVRIPAGQLALLADLQAFEEWLGKLDGEFHAERDCKPAGYRRQFVENNIKMFNDLFCIYSSHLI